MGFLSLRRSLASAGALTLLLVSLSPLISTAALPPTNSSIDIEEGWWVETTVDRNRNGMGDMVERFQSDPIFLDERGTLPLIIDFDHTPDENDIRMLEQTVDFEHQWTLKLIDAVVGRVPVDRIWDIVGLDGVVMIELDGILEIANVEAAEVHSVDIAREQTGYDGSGTTVAIIDTGIDGNHVSLDDQDDINGTYDPKVIAFYDAVNAPDKTNGTEVFPYDDQGHGSHCAGTTAGTGAPNPELYAGMAPGASLVGVKVLDSGGSGSFGTVMAGMEWTVEKRYVYNIRAASMSLGGPGAIEWTSSEEDSVNRMGNRMMEASIALFIAAGNNAVSAQIGTPGSAEDVITVGALDKDTSIAIYSSQGPTEEGRIKPNIAFVGSDIMSVEANSGNGYVSMSGTSMATPGAAGVGALMLQANPELSAFEIRNILQENATYRPCHHMAANEPCAEDLIPKNRQNNVYGHGHVNADLSLNRAATLDYGFNENLRLNVNSMHQMDNHHHLNPGDSLQISLTKGADTIQWRSNHLRDEWTNLHSYSPGSTIAALSYHDIAHEIEHLVDKVVIQNHTLSIRALQNSDESSSPLITVNIMMGDAVTATVENKGFLPLGDVVLITVGALMCTALSRRDEEPNQR